MARSPKMRVAICEVVPGAPSSGQGTGARRLDVNIQTIGVPAATGLRLHPDGHRLAFVAGESTSELWVVENFLPVLARRN